MNFPRWEHAILRKPITDEVSYLCFKALKKKAFGCVAAAKATNHI